MPDSSGIVVVYYHTPAEYVNNYNLSFTHILSGYDDREDGKVVVTRGNQIIASNDDSMVGEDVYKYNVIKKIKETGASGKIVHADSNRRWGSHNYGLMERGRDYYVRSEEHTSELQSR